LGVESARNLLDELGVVLKTFPKGERLLVLAQLEQAMRQRGDLARLRAIKEYRRLHSPPTTSTKLPPSAS
jgi:hypothetical protein